jgi:hypothetical protein
MSLVYSIKQKEQRKRSKPRLGSVLEDTDFGRSKQQKRVPAKPGNILLTAQDLGSLQVLEQAGVETNLIKMQHKDLIQEIPLEECLLVINLGQSLG